MIFPEDTLLASLPHPDRSALADVSQLEKTRPMVALAHAELQAADDHDSSLLDRALAIAEDARAHAYLLAKTLARHGARSGYDQAFQQGLQRLKQTCRQLNNHRFSLLPLRLMLQAAQAEGDLHQAQSILDQAQSLLITEPADSDPQLEWRIHQLGILQDMGHWLEVETLLAQISPYRQQLLEQIGYDSLEVDTLQYLITTWRLEEAIQVSQANKHNPQIAMFRAAAFAWLGDHQGAQQVLLSCREHIDPRRYILAHAELAYATGDIPQLLEISNQYLAIADDRHRELILAESALLRGRPQQARIAIRNRGSEADAIRMRIALHERDMSSALPHAKAIIARAGKGGLIAALHTACEVQGPALLGLWLAVNDNATPAPRRTPAPAPTSHSSQALSTLVGSSPVMQALRQHIAVIAQRSEPVLITGETGTGKELVAHALHRIGRADKPFIAVNCSGLPESLAEATLFGHRKGSFTGAHEHNHGLIHLAQDGVLFLDEIDSMPLSMQGLFLRLLESGDYWPIGSSQPRKLKARIVAACQRPLEEAVQSGRCREDLRYRLERLTVELPPLRTHPEDIPDLFTHFSNAMGETPQQPPAHILSEWQQHSWPGNVRELRNAAERFIILGDQQPPSSPLPFLPTAAPDQPSAMTTPVDPLGTPSAARRRRGILDLFSRIPEVSRKVVCENLGCAPKTAAEDLHALESHGLIRRISNGPPRLHYFVLTTGQKM